MGNRGRALSVALGVLIGASRMLAADQIWTGRIGDSSCGHSHKSAIEHAGKKLSDADCTRACVKGGGKYVFVSGNKVYNIENQDYAGLDANAGAAVMTGQATGDTIRISSLQGAGKAKS